MEYHEMIDAVNHAKRTIRLADNAIRQLSTLLPGRLKKANVPRSVLSDLKRELKDFNIQTGQWKK